MDIRFTDEELAFQVEVRQFYDQALDDGLKKTRFGAKAA